MYNPTNSFTAEFPTTPEEFDRVEVFGTTMVRIDFIKWMNTMYKRYSCTNRHSKKEKATYYINIMITSFERINYLYKIQVSINFQAKKSINIKLDNEYYNIFFKSS